MRSAAIQSPSPFVGQPGGEMESVTERGPAGLVRRTWVGRLAVLGVVSFLVAMLWPPGMAFSTPASGRTRVLAPSFGVPDLGRSLLNPAPGAGTTPALAVHTNVPSPGSTSSQLVGDACTSASNCWAVGTYDNVAGATLNQALHWNGTAWSQATTPNPGGTASGDRSGLRRIACPSSTRCWAVGDYKPSGGAQLNQILRWNGTAWSQATTPNPGGTTSSSQSQLLGVYCTSTSNCWAVGAYVNGSGATLNEILRWNGSQWSKVKAPQPGGISSPDDASELLEVACSSGSNCKAVGVYGNSSGALLNEGLRWNGTKWSTVPMPDPGTTASAAVNLLLSVSCTSATNCWAVGVYIKYDATKAALNEILHWNGTRWALVKAPHPGLAGNNQGSLLQNVRCTSASNCWAVGQYQNLSAAIVNQALHWNGNTWSLVSTPNPGGTGNSSDSSMLQGVDCGAASSCWAVGSYKSGSNTLNEALRWKGGRWSVG